MERESKEMQAKGDYMAMTKGIEVNSVLRGQGIVHEAPRWTECAGGCLGASFGDP